MRHVFLHAMRRHQGGILGWGLSLGGLALLMTTFYDTIADQQDQFQALIENYPPEFMAFFGGTEQLFTPQGFLGAEFFSFIPVVLGIFALLAGSGMLASDEESGVMDLLLAHPISRTGLFLGRFLAYVAALVGILILAYIGMWIGASYSQALDLTGLELVRPFVSLGAMLLLFGNLALMLSLLLPSRRMAAMVSGIVLVGSYFVTSLANLEESLDALARFSPFNYYQSADAMSGLNLEWIAGLLGVAMAFALLAWRRFQHRDIRVSGEGGWALSAPVRWLRRGTGA